MADYDNTDGGDIVEEYRYRESTEEFVNNEPDEPDGHNEPNEFIDTGEGESDKEEYVGGDWTYGGRHGHMLCTCFISFIVIVIIIFIYKSMNRNKHINILHNCPNPSNPSIVSPVFDNTMVPTTYFDYNNHGKQYVNW